MFVQCSKVAAATEYPSIIQSRRHPCSRSTSSAAANEAAISQFAHFAKLSLANLEKFAELGLGAARDSVEQATEHAAGPRRREDVHEVIAINSAALEPAMKRAYAVLAHRLRDRRRDQRRSEEGVREADRRAQQGRHRRPRRGLQVRARRFRDRRRQREVRDRRRAERLRRTSPSINKQIYDTVEKAVEQNVASVQSATKAPKAPVRKAKRK